MRAIALSRMPPNAEPGEFSVLNRRNRPDPQIVETVGFCYVGCMTLDSRSRRRWFGTVCLLGAVAMLVVGQTVLAARLSGLGFLLYWLVCFALTLVATCFALIDVRELRRRGRDEQRELLETTLKRIEREKSGRG
jgi:hypothetical protein